MSYTRTTTVNAAPGGDTVKQAVLDLDTDLTAAFTHLNTHEALTATHGATGAVVGTTNAQTLTNKTLTAPTISNANLTGIPTAPTAALGTNTTQLATMAALQAAVFDSANLPAQTGNAGKVITTDGESASWGYPEAATQAEMEAITSNLKTLTPLNANWHPGVCKAWGRVASDGSLIAGYNVTSSVRNSLGNYTVTLDKDFSNTSYVVLGKSAGYNHIISEPSTAGAFIVTMLNGAMTLNADYIFTFACFGDQ